MMNQQSKTILMLVLVRDLVTVSYLYRLSSTSPLHTRKSPRPTPIDPSQPVLYTSYTKSTCQTRHLTVRDTAKNYQTADHLSL
ncbi:hypothetical protein BDZ85DRAFT_265905 [Elsinoe ampelina]|uniref:Secreted protein n=1 Tax=Elsinoe ampelina TaxID=302913 RepID=A0A6A6G557_9PEZI|nr:hypothetical protein BDZ85DRAFT_265905 [Elsinoe ampelina]